MSKNPPIRFEDVKNAPQVQLRQPIQQIPSPETEKLFEEANEYQGESSNSSGGIGTDSAVQAPPAQAQSLVLSAENQGKIFYWLIIYFIHNFPLFEFSSFFLNYNFKTTKNRSLEQFKLTK